MRLRQRDAASVEAVGEEGRWTGAGGGAVDSAVVWAVKVIQYYVF
jgi:hypothetical protein